MARGLLKVPVYGQISFLVLRHAFRGPSGRDDEASGSIGFDGVWNAHAWQQA